MAIMTVKEEAILKIRPWSQHGHFPYVDCLFDKTFEISSYELMSRPLLRIVNPQNFVTIE